MAVTMAAALVFGMTACVGGDPLPTLPPTPDSTPIFSSEEEALAAAEAAYAAYNEVSDQIAADGGVDPDRIAPFVTPEQLIAETETAEIFQAQGWHTEGTATMSKFQLQQLDQDGPKAEVIVYVCLDVSSVVVRDASGADVTPAGRSPIVALEVTFEASSPVDILIAGSEQWPGSSFC